MMDINTNDSIQRMKNIKNNYVLFENKNTGKFYSRKEMELVSHAVSGLVLEEYMKTEEFLDRFRMIEEPRISLLSIYKNRYNSELACEFIRYTLLCQYEELITTISENNLIKLSNEIFKVFLKHMDFISVNKSMFNINSVANNFDFRFIDLMHELTRLYRDYFIGPSGNVYVKDLHKIEYGYNTGKPFSFALPNGVVVTYKIGLGPSDPVTDDGYTISITPWIYKNVKSRLEDPNISLHSTLSGVKVINTNYTIIDFEELVFHLMWDMSII